MDSLFAEMTQKILEQSEHYQKYMQAENELHKVIKQCFYEADRRQLDINTLLNDLDMNEIQRITLDRQHKMDNLYYYDMMIHPMVKNHSCLGETLLNEEEDISHKVLKAMMRSRLVPFTVLSRNNSTGKVECYNLLSHQHFYLTDANLGIFDASKELYIGRIVTYNNITFLSDYLLTFKKNKKNLDLVYSNRKRFNEKYQGYISSLCFYYYRINGIHPEEFKGLAYNM